MKKSFKYILTGVLLALLAVGIAACKTEEERLSAPTNLQVTQDDILTWDEVADADGYLVEIGEMEFETKTNSLDLFKAVTVPNEYEIRVLAWNIRSSAQSEPLSYIVNKPQGLAYHLTDDGTGYRVKVVDKNSMTGKVAIPERINGTPVKEIVQSAFNECEGLTGLILPDTVEEMGRKAFYKCINLRRIRLPAYIETIGSDSFFGCEALKEISLPEGLRKIESCAFMKCASLEKIEIPAAVERIDIGVFELCRSLKSLTVDEGNPTFRSEGNCIIKKSDGALMAGCNASVIPQGVTAIERYAFSFCEELKELTIPASVTRIEYGAFANCYALEKLELSNGLKELNGSSIFRNCKSLNSLNIPRTIEKINVGSGLFFSGAGILSLTVDEENPNYYADGNCIIRKSDGVLVVGCDSSVIPDYVEEIGDCAFSGCQMEKISFPVGLKTIGAYSFEGCPLTRVYIPESVESIGGGAFKGCGLLSVILPGSVTTIGVDAFGEPFDIYTSAERDNEGWYSESVTYKWCYKAHVWYGSAQRDEDGLYYVYSITIKKYRTGGISSVPSFDPYREGYIFKGWATQGGTEPLFERTLLVTEVDGTKYERYVYLTIEQAKAAFPEGETTLYAIWEKA